ncbi:uncharacterized protein VICG_00056 [Vittaforma corneae ATCC 50505]|uniref:Cleavage and polyadenylation specificity factor subunit 2 n=1 Tax=Vittaforma corneae (strain ATCC 50505) TaxID=993615 RepID=L2GPI3_VITCO|nr:uncharacterized protein VICG_00056 [Vittaforma corneae ATCC 50505]ELA42741.1 hypothetical protein VICG_00056 [Vittaforma corneae ATCC 50505]
MPMLENKISIKPLIDTKTGVFCHLLQIDNIKLIVDCGIGKDFDYSIYDTVKETIQNADCILLTSFDLQHMGAIGLFADSQIFCTIPTAVLGKIVLDELNHNLGDRILSSFFPKQIKYSQPFKIKDVEITSFNAGHIIGNSIYRIVKDLELVVICYNFNHRKEHFLDGFSHSNIENASIFITNTSYLSITPYTLRTRDDKIHEVLSKSQGSILFSVAYQRLLELLCILHKHKVAIVSRNGKMFLDRIKSMVEWAGSKATDIIPLLNISFLKVNELSDQKIIILVNELCSEGYAGAVIEKFNQKQNTLVFIDQDYNSIDFSNIKVFSYAYKEKQLEPVPEKIEIRSDEDEENEDEHWSKEKSTFFVHGTLERKNFFPYIKRRRQNNEYGEPVLFKFESKIDETELRMPVVREVEEIEERRLVYTGIIPEISLMSIDLYGTSDYVSYKTICEGSNCKRLVIAEDFRDNALFLYTYFNTCRLGINSYIASEMVSFSSTSPAEKISITENVMNQEFYKLCDTSVAHFKAFQGPGPAGVCRMLSASNSRQFEY